MTAGTAVRETEHYLDVVEQLNPKLNAVLTVTADMALEQAHAADKATENGEWLEILHGVPMLVKNCLNVTGVRTTFGTDLYRDNISNSDSVVVARARNCGPVFLGKTNLPEFCYGATTENGHYRILPQSMGPAACFGRLQRWRRRRRKADITTKGSRLHDARSEARKRRG